MNITALCKREVVGIAANASIHQAATLMCEEHVGSLVVVTRDEPPKVVGILTDRDLALDVLGKEAPVGKLCVADIAKAPPVAVGSGSSLQEAVEAMEKAGVRRLLVVDADGGVVGLLAAEDLMAAIAEELASLSRALRKGIAREKSDRKVFTRTAGVRPVYPAFGLAME